MTNQRKENEIFFEGTSACCERHAEFGLKVYADGRNTLTVSPGKLDPDDEQEEKKAFSFSLADHESDRFFEFMAEYMRTVLSAKLYAGEEVEAEGMTQTFLPTIFWQEQQEKDKTVYTLPKNIRKKFHKNIFDPEKVSVTIEDKGDGDTELLVFKAEGLDLSLTYDQFCLIRDFGVFVYEKIIDRFFENMSREKILRELFGGFLDV